jgi:hypothetical protein
LKDCQKDSNNFEGLSEGLEQHWRTVRRTRTTLKDYQKDSNNFEGLSERLEQHWRTVRRTRTTLMDCQRTRITLKDCQKDSNSFEGLSEGLEQLRSNCQNDSNNFERLLEGLDGSNNIFPIPYFTSSPCWHSEFQNMRYFPRTCIRRSVLYLGLHLRSVW